MATSTASGSSSHHATSLSHGEEGAPFGSASISGWRAIIRPAHCSASASIGRMASKAPVQIAILWRVASPLTDRLKSARTALATARGLRVPDGLGSDCRDVAEVSARAGISARRISARREKSQSQSSSHGVT